MGLLDFVKRTKISIEDKIDPLGEKKYITDDEVDYWYERAVDMVLKEQFPSASFLQHRLHLPYSAAARLIDRMENDGIVSPFDGKNPRKILVSSTPEDKTAYEEEQIVEKSKGVSLDSVDSMEGQEFEYWCSDLLKRNGFSSVEVTKGSGDQGVDIVATKDGVRYAIQCKRYISSLGNKPVQEVHAGKTIYKCHVGVVMTNSYFTSGAKELAEATGVLLWDRDTLQAMMAVAEKMEKQL